MKARTRRIVLALTCLTLAPFAAGAGKPGSPAVKAGTTTIPSIFDGFREPPAEVVARRPRPEWSRFNSVEAFDQITAELKPLREQQTRSSSGLLAITNAHFALREALAEAHYWPDQEQTFDQRYDEWVRTRPTDPTPHVVKGYLLYGKLRRAMHFEATGYQLPKPDGYPQPEPETVARRSAQLAAFLEATRAQAAADPGWYLIKISALRQLCAPIDEIVAVAEEGLQRAPASYQLLFEVVLAGVECRSTALQPLVQRVINLGARTAGKAKADVIYARMMWFLTQIYAQDAFFASPLVDWQRMRRGIETVMRQYPDAWNTNHFAKFACIARDRALARRLLPKAGEAPVTAVWQEQDVFDTCWKWAMAT